MYVPENPYTPKMAMKLENDGTWGSTVPNHGFWRQSPEFEGTKMPSANHWELSSKNSSASCGNFWDLRSHISWYLPFEQWMLSVKLDGGACASQHHELDSQFMGCLVDLWATYQCVDYETHINFFTRRVIPIMNPVCNILRGYIIVPKQKSMSYPSPNFPSFPILSSFVPFPFPIHFLSTVSGFPLILESLSDLFPSVPFLFHIWICCMFFSPIVSMSFPLNNVSQIFSIPVPSLKFQYVAFLNLCPYFPIVSAYPFQNFKSGPIFPIAFPHFFLIFSKHKYSHSSTISLISYIKDPCIPDKHP